jgi:hypothetical protein
VQFQKELFPFEWADRLDIWVLDSVVGDLEANPNGERVGYV